MNDRPVVLSEWVWNGFEHKVRRTYSGKIAGTVDAKMRPHRWEAEGDGFVNVGYAETVEDAQAACDAALSRMKCYELPGQQPCRSMTTGLPLVDDADRLAPAAYLPHAIAALHDVLKVGAERYPDEKWKTQNVAEHLRHAREHIRLHTIGDDSEPHLRHALTRLAFAVELNEGGGK